MFKKKTCKKCGERINDKYNFCPYCRFPLNDDSEENWGMLGKNDFMTPTENIKLPMGFNTIFNTLIKSLNKQFGELDKEMQREVSKTNMSPRTNIRLMINGKEINLNNKGRVQEQKEKTSKRASKQKLDLPKKDFSKFSKLPKIEPKTNIRRLSNKVIYEINMPGVKSTRDLSIIQLENSIEIKALGNKKVYFKIIPINLPIRDYNLSKGKLLLELEAKD
jgi:HSP20 family molecular chaperone IbpA